MNKNIILAGAVAIGIYLFSQAKNIPFITEAQKTAQRRSSATTSTRQRTAQKIAQKIAQKVAQKRIGQPITRIAYIAAARKVAAQKKVRQEAAQKIGKI